MIKLCEDCNVEFHWREAPQVETFDIGIPPHDVRQIMANFWLWQGVQEVSRVRR